MNRIQLSATLVSISELRYTPAGVPVLELILAHAGEVAEAEVPRQLEFEFDAIALGDVAARLARERLGSKLAVTGFVAPRSRKSRRLRVHINGYAIE